MPLSYFGRFGENIVKQKRPSNVANVVPSLRKPKKPKNKTAAQRALDSEWASMLAKHAGPLEAGRKAKGALPDVKVKKRRTKHVEQVTVPPLTTPPGRETPKLPSKVTPGGSTAKKEQQTYTGTKMLGVATMHKSNQVPIFSDEAAIDIANMRRNEYTRDPKKG
jgi:hypothetical protein